MYIYGKFKAVLKIGLFAVPSMLLPAMFAHIGVIQAQEKIGVMTLADAVSSGIMSNPEYGVAASARRGTDEELRQARGLYLPSLDMRVDGGYEHSDDPATRAGAGSDEENMWRYDSSLTLTQMLFDGWESRYEVARQKNRVLSSAHRVRETSELIGLSIVEAYLEVLRQRQLFGIAEKNVADHEVILRQITDGAQAGRSTQADVEQTKARYASSKAQRANVIQQLRIAEANFRQEVGDDPDVLAPPTIPGEILAEDLNSEVIQALSQSPTLDIFKTDIDVAYAEYKGTAASLYPQFDLQLNARQGSSLNGVDGRDTSASALVVMNWNLYRGGADVARIREFTHRHQQAKESRAEAARAVENDVRQTWARMRAAAARKVEFEAQASANARVVRAYKDQFELDRRTLLDVLDAQNEMFVSRSNAINAGFLEMFSVYRLLALKGRLLASLDVAYPAESSTIED